MAAWRGLFGKLKWLLVVAAVLVAVAVGASFFPFGGAMAVADDRLTRRETTLSTAAMERAARAQRWEERRRKRRAEWAAKTKAREDLVRREEERLAKEPPPKRRRRRFAWGSPVEFRQHAWNVPEGGMTREEATLTAFVRICISEADGAAQDCVGIWQVLRNIRRKSCPHDRIHRITECDQDGETMLSVMRRAQPHILAMPGYKLRNRRAGWIRNMTTDCESVPEGWLGNENQWNAAYGTKVCPQTVELGQYLMKGQLPPEAPGRRPRWLQGSPITWGGRCETKRASCDDRMACARGLVRLKTTTHNAFWRRPAFEGEVEPICAQHGFAAGTPDPEPDRTGDDNAADNVAEISDTSEEGDENS